MACQKWLLTKMEPRSHLVFGFPVVSDNKSTLTDPNMISALAWLNESVDLELEDR